MASISMDMKSELGVGGLERLCVPEFHRGPMKSRDTTGRLVTDLLTDAPLPLPGLQDRVPGSTNEEATGQKRWQSPVSLQGDRPCLLRERAGTGGQPLLWLPQTWQSPAPRALLQPSPPPPSSCHCRTLLLRGRPTSTQPRICANHYCPRTACSSQHRPCPGTLARP